jgi:hypothetical protein
MGKRISFFFLSLASLLFVTSCYSEGWRVTIETRTALIGTNIIGFVGASDARIEIIFSAADEENPGYNVTRSITVSPAYLFHAGNVYMTLQYEVWEHPHEDTFSLKRLVRNFGEGSAEYLRIINRSEAETVEFFLVPTFTNFAPGAFPQIPSIWYRNAPIYFLLYPNRKPPFNINLPNGNVIYFYGDRIGDLTVLEDEGWSTERVAELFRAEFNRCENTQLTFYDFRLIDLVEGNYPELGWRGLSGRIFHGIIGPEQEFLGTEDFWSLATPELFPSLDILEGVPF